MSGVAWRRACATSACVQVAALGGGMFGITTTTGMTLGSVVVASEKEWLTFTDAVKRGDFDDLRPCSSPAK